uniref:Uncharacterized protein n=1 Tax=Tanacetum cinerariifolium TaxID=118510 RepID=A0A6L2L786_TANCI|nr:hypothetical protein [Tanacetum cinerariifolium]
MHHLKPQTVESREGLMRNRLKNGGKNTRIGCLRSMVQQEHASVEEHAWSHMMETGVAGRVRPFGIEITNVECVEATMLNEETRLKIAF